MDRPFAFELERAEAERQAGYASTLASMGFPTATLEVGGGPEVGGLGVSCGADFPVNRGMALGLREPLQGAHLDALEGFLKARGFAPMLDICPLVDASVFDLLAARGYAVRRALNNYVFALEALEGVVLQGAVLQDAAPDLEVRELGPGESHVWEEVSYRAWGDPRTEDASRMLARTAFLMPGARTFAAVQNGVPVGVGAVVRCGRIVTLFGGGTLPQARGRGVQAALLRARLGIAREMGGAFATSSANAGETSSRNLERAGFRLAYTKLRFEQARVGRRA